MSAWAQEPRGIEGTVVNALTGAPVRRVAVIEVGAHQRTPPQYTDAEGKFRFPALGPGKYVLRMDKPGYFPDGNGETAVTLNTFEERKVLTLKLTPGGVVNGVVMDEEGEPIAASAVTLLRRAYVGGRRQLVEVESRSTDDRGQYRFYGLRPGRYLVRAVTGQSFGAGEVYPPTFHPNATEPDEAPPILVAAGQELRGINIAIRPSRGFRVAGRVVNGLTNTPLTNVSISLAPRGIRGTGAMANVMDAGGNFSLVGVMPGQYDLSSSYMIDNRALRARVLLTVNRDVENLQVTLLPGVQIQGRVKVEGQGALDLSKVGIAAESLDDMIGGGGGARTAADGTFTMGPLLAERYSPMIYNLPGAYFKSLLVAEQEAAALDLSALAGQTIAVTFLVSLNGAKLDGSTDPGAVVALVPATDAPYRRTRYRLAEANAEGRFTLNGIAPGSYTLYAFKNVEPGSWTDDAFLAGLADPGVSVKLDERESKTQAVRAQ